MTDEAAALLGAPRGRRGDGLRERRDGLVVPLPDGARVRARRSVECRRAATTRSSLLASRCSHAGRRGGRLRPARRRGLPPRLRGATLGDDETPSDPTLAVTDVAVARCHACGRRAPVLRQHLRARRLYSGRSTSAPTSPGRAPRSTSPGARPARGVVTTRDPPCTSACVVRRHRRRHLAPIPTWLLLRPAHVARAPAAPGRDRGELARRLAAHPARSRPLPGPTGSSGARLARGRCRPRRQGPGLRAGRRIVAGRCEEAVRLLRDATSLGGVETLIERRACIEPEGTCRRASAWSPSGLEDVEDLWADLEQAIAAGADAARPADARTTAVRVAPVALGTARLVLRALRARSRRPHSRSPHAHAGGPGAPSARSRSRGPGAPPRRCGAPPASPHAAARQPDLAERAAGRAPRRAPRGDRQRDGEVRGGLVDPHAAGDVDEHVGGPSTEPACRASTASSSARRLRSKPRREPPRAIASVARATSACTSTSSGRAALHRADDDRARRAELRAVRCSAAVRDRLQPALAHLEQADLARRAEAVLCARSTRSGRRVALDHAARRRRGARGRAGRRPRRPSSRGRSARS